VAPLLGPEYAVNMTAAAKRRGVAGKMRNLSFQLRHLLAQIMRLHYSVAAQKEAPIDQGRSLSGE
jgi:hypothetical protein